MLKFTHWGLTPGVGSGIALWGNSWHSKNFMSVPQVSRWAGGCSVGKGLSGLYLRNCKVYELILGRDIGQGEWVYNVMV